MCSLLLFWFFFFFKQKTAYEMRISDWSSDVCSSDLTVGSLTVNPENQPGAQRLREIQAKIATLGARCVFTEPQFEPRLAQVVVEGSAARTGTLDPLGANLPDGPELYFELLRANAASLKTCLAEAS